MAALRELLEGALYSYGNLFGVHLDIDFDKGLQNKKRDDRLLIKLNQSQNNTPNNIRSFLHAGIIGQGLKFPTKEASSPDSEIRNMLLRAIIACCKQEVRSIFVFLFVDVAVFFAHKLLIVFVYLTSVISNYYLGYFQEH